MTGRRVLILDTSILCCWLQVPGKDSFGSGDNHWNHERVSQVIDAEQSKNSLFVLPVASIIETGNHIAQSKACQTRLQGDCGAGQQAGTDALGGAGEERRLLSCLSRQALNNSFDNKR